MEKIYPKGYWTFDKCKEEASKYTSRKEFNRMNVSAFNASYRNGWLDGICNHMINPNLKWSFDKCKEEALKYNSRSEFQNKSKGAYLYAFRNNFLNDICIHMNNYTPNGYWSFENCKEEALKYTNKSDFIKNSLGAYDATHRNGWIPDVCSHMIPKASCKDRYIYAFEFIDTKHVYVGLTYNLQIRENAHLNNKNSAVFKYIRNNNSNYIFKELGYYDMNAASVKEIEFVELYKNNGWSILNQIKAGGLGGNKIIWNYDTCKVEALKYSIRKDFANAQNGAYGVARVNGWLDDVCSHMEEIKKANNYWSYDKCKEEALKYSSKTEFKNNCSSAYKVSYLNKWLDEICSHMKKIYGKWNYDTCKIEASKYKNMSQFHKNNHTAYNYAYRHDYLKDYFN